jgi:hypothetical protein
MGTAKDWIVVVLISCIWAGIMFALSISRRKDRDFKLLHVTQIVFWTLAGLFLGLFLGLRSQFGWRAFQTIFVYLTAGAFVGSVIVAILIRHKRSKYDKLS